jgi:hypothetical protein
MLGLNLENESFSFSGGIAGCSGLSEIISKIMRNHLFDIFKTFIEILINLRGLKT